MSKKRTFEAKLEAIARLRKEGPSADATSVLRSALEDDSAYLVTEAAQVIAAQNLKELGDALANAFARFMIDPAETDKGCRALIAITDALNQIDYQKPDVFLQGVRHLQRTWDGSRETDHAAPLRGHAAMGLARIEYPGVLNILVELLLDKESAARIGAVRALAGTGKLAVVPLLRFKLLQGDQESGVLGSCFAGLIALEPAESIPFVADFLRGEGEISQEAALALGESRRPEALDVLKQAWRRGASEDMRDALLLAIAMLRLPAATDFLLEVLAGSDKPTALCALRALAIHRHNPDVRKRALAAITGKDKALSDLFERKFRIAE